MNAVVVPPTNTEVSAATEPVNLLQIIERAARDQSIDIDKMERLMAMHERMVARNAESEFNAAMQACQAEMRRIAADAENPQTRSDYASYGKLDQTLRPIYTRHGFSLSFSDGETAKQDYVRVVCTIRHRAGHKETHWKDMPADGKGAKGGDVMTKTHAAGAAQTYGMRYLLKGIFNVAIGEDDTDGNEPEECVTEQQVADLEALITEVKANKAAFLKYIKVQSLGDIYARNYSHVVKLLEAKRAKQ